MFERSPRRFPTPESNNLWEKKAQQELCLIFGEDKKPDRLEKTPGERATFSITQHFPTPLETENSGFDLAISGVENPLITKTSHEKRWRVTEAHFQINEKNVPLSALLPPDYKVFLVPEGLMACDTESKEVFVNKLQTPRDIAALLHEIGHGHSATKDPGALNTSGEEIVGFNRDKFDLVKNIMPELVKTVSKDERDAWANAFRLARNNGIPLNNAIRQLLQKALTTYDMQNSLLTLRGSSRETFATNEQRKLMRSPEKVLEAQRLEDLGLAARELLTTLEKNATPEQADKKFQFTFQATNLNRYTIERLRTEVDSFKITCIEPAAPDKSTITTLEIDGSLAMRLTKQQPDTAEPEHIVELDVLSNVILGSDEITCRFAAAQAIFNALNEPANQASMCLAFRDALSNTPPSRKVA